MKAGLLGAIGGVGKALEGYGTDLMKRREQALEDARELAKEERRRLDAREREDRQTGLRIDLASLSDKRIREEGAATRTAADARATAAQQHREKMVPITEASRKRIVDYSSMKARGNADHARAEAKRLEDAGVVDAFASGKPVKRPDGQMREQIMHELGDGTIVETNQWITPGSKLSRPPPRKPAAGGSMADSLDLDPDEDEEEE